MITTTLNDIRAHHPCADGWSKLLKHLGKTAPDSEPLSLLTILESNGLDDTLWCLRAVPGYDREFRLYAVWCARQVQHLMTDQRSLDVLDVAERYANGQATDEELQAARNAAGAAWAAGDPDWAAAGAAAGAADWDTGATAWAARATRDAGDAQRIELIRLIEEGHEYQI